jgi:hypothetical protein
MKTLKSRATPMSVSHCPRRQAAWTSRAGVSARPWDGVKLSPPRDGCKLDPPTDGGPRRGQSDGHLMQAANKASIRGQACGRLGKRCEWQWRCIWQRRQRQATNSRGQSSGRLRGQSWTPRRALRLAVALHVAAKSGNGHRTRRSAPQMDGKWPSNSKMDGMWPRKSERRGACSAGATRVID